VRPIGSRLRPYPRRNCPLLGSLRNFDTNLDIDSSRVRVRPTNMFGGYSPLLDLPLELQEIIYKEVLLQPSQGPQLLRVCHEIYKKAHKFLFQRALRFEDQWALQRWVQGVPPDYLQYVGEIAVGLQDVELTPLLASTPATSSVSSDSSASTPRIWDFYERGLTNLRQVFEELPNVKKLTIRASLGHQSRLYQDHLDKALTMMGMVYPGLHELRLDGNMHHQSLTFLPTFKYLKGFSFDGFSATEASQTAEILSSLQLTSLSLISQHGLITPTHNQERSRFTDKLQSFDSDVLRALNPLGSFSVTESRPRSSTALFFTSEILSSLHNHQTLSKLSICLSHIPESDTVDALKNFFQNNSTIQRLELDWPDLDPDILEDHALLPNSLQHVWIRSSTLATAAKILRHMLESREAAGVPNLRWVVLGRHAWEPDAEGRWHDRVAPAVVHLNGSAQAHAESVSCNLLCGSMRLPLCSRYKMHRKRETGVVIIQGMACQRPFGYAIQRTLSPASRIWTHLVPAPRSVPPRPCAVVT
jgi:hypothetical protein